VLRWNTGAALAMLLRFLSVGALVFLAEGYFSEEMFPEESKMQHPTVVIAILARNSAHSLPYYLGALERLNYPKDRVSVWWVLLHAPGRPGEPPSRSPAAAAVQPR